MDQIKIGKFILEERKRKGYNQKQLAEILSVSDKAVSKWENGNGIPDVSLLLPLCEELEISVNELLAGERLSESEYRSRAEENMMRLVQENQLSYSRRIRSLWGSMCKIFGGVALILLTITLFSIFIDQQVAGAVGVNGIVWLCLGGLSGIISTLEKYRHREIKKTGSCYEARVTDILPSAFIRVGNYVTCRVLCTYEHQGQQYTVKSGYILLTHFDQREDLRAVVYAESTGKRRSSVELFGRK